MKKLIAAGNLYFKKLDLTDIALLKFCMCSVGVLVGLCAAKRHKKSAGILAGLVFVCTYVPLMGRFLLALVETED